MKRFTLAKRLVALLVFAASLITYILTVEPTASYWDCPEYITNAYGLEPGHPPGNPTWMLTAHLAAMIAPAPQYVALAVNLTSGLFTALAAMLLYLSAVILLSRILTRGVADSAADRWLVIAGAAVAAMTFAWCDTAWFSAVEAEIYAMSIFFTALVVWIMLLWSEKSYTDPAADRYIILAAYLTGLSIGVHQLNLLSLPACALIYLFHRKSNTSKWRITAYLLASFALIAMLLFGMMPATAEWAETFELLFTDKFHLPMAWGELTYVSLTLAIGIAACAVTARDGDSFAAKTLFCLLTLMSGIFAFKGKLWLGAALSAALFLILTPKAVGYRKMVVATWSLMMVLTGYGTYATIMIRAHANPYLNTGMADNPFSFSSYLGRDQYGSAPLLYGRTPNSARLRLEEISGDPEDGTLTASYANLYREVKSLTRRPAKDGSGYVVIDTVYDYRLTPELNMIMPRIWSGSEVDKSGYKDWAGVEESTMVPVEVSEAVDSLGNAVGRLDTQSGERHKTTAYRPTYLQNLTYFGGYQLGYMYLRYLMWNFCGRQNDVLSQGQADAGNFITGFSPVDNLMLSVDLDTLPADYWRDNRGRNVYYMLPFILGVFGMVWLTMRRRAGRRAFSIFFTLFIMTGLAIVIYLNQTPGEPRERDYAFIGSFYAFSFFIGCGVPAVAAVLSKFLSRRWSVAVAALAGLGSCTLMFAENYDDHDRSGRTLTRDLAANLLEALDPDAIIIVDGDNYTFPVWYAQEVEKIRPDVRVVNLAYSTLGWYIDQLCTPTAGAEGIPLTGAGKGFIYNKYKRVPLDPGLRVPMDAVAALDSLYRMEAPVMPTMVLRLAPAPGASDSIIVDLAERLPRGRREIRQNELLLLDMMATSAARGWSRPIYWHEAVARRPEVKMYEYQRTIGPVVRFTPDSLASRNPDLDRAYNLYMNKFRYGGLSDPDVYADLTSRQMAAYERKTMGRVAKGLFERGDTAKALALFEKMERELPAHSVPYRMTKIPHSYFNEGIEAGLVYALVGVSRGDSALRGHGLRMLEDEMRRCRAQARYRSALPPSMRHAVTIPNIMGANAWFYPLDAYLKVGGSVDNKEARALLAGRDLAAEQRNWDRDVSLKRLITNVRDYVAGRLSPAEQAAFFADLRLYYANGGTAAELQTYREFDDFNF